VICQFLFLLQYIGEIKIINSNSRYKATEDPVQVRVRDGRKRESYATSCVGIRDSFYRATQLC